MSPVKSQDPHKRELGVPQAGWRHDDDAIRQAGDGGKGQEPSNAGVGRSHGPGSLQPPEGISLASALTFVYRPHLKVLTSGY